jgi:hypothetical protein
MSQLKAVIFGAIGTIAATQSGALRRVPQIAKTVLVSDGRDEAQHAIISPN